MCSWGCRDGSTFEKVIGFGNLHLVAEQYGTFTLIQTLVRLRLTGGAGQGVRG